MSSGLPKPLSTTAEPCAASARAMPSPMPLVEPVTSETLPSSDRVASIMRAGVAMFMAALPRCLCVWEDSAPAFSSVEMPMRYRIDRMALSPRHDDRALSGP